MMKRILTIFLILFLVFPQGSKAQTKSYVIGFYNVENLFDIYDDPAKNDEEFLPEGKNNWTETKYEKKLHNIAAVIKAMAEDNKRYHTVLGLSEIENRLVLDDLVNCEEIASANYQIVHYDGPDRRGVDVALLYRPGQFKYLDSESIPYSFSPTEVEITLDEKAQEDFRTRDILMVRGEIDGEMFAFYVTHLPSRLGGKGSDLRSRGAEIIYNHAQNLMKQYPGIKIAVMGDMNDDPFDESMVKYLHGKSDLDDVGQEDFFNPFYTLLEDGYGSLCYRDVWSIYDQILVNSNLAKGKGYKVKPFVKGKYYGRVFKKPFMTTQKGQYKDYPFRTFSNGAFIGGYSDHYPTYIVITK